MRGMALVLASLLTGGCVSPPDTIRPVAGLDAERYLGTWYEIARLDHRFERGLERVTATYGARDDGGISVVNRGYDAADGAWSEASGVAYFVGDRDTGYLKVSFFRPFYAPYVIFDLDPGYRTAYVTGDGEKYLWFLARTPTVAAAERERFVSTVEALGFDTTGLIWVRQGD
jgi:apolipoprotein D and lipocalin family protein